jgi:hypothetical protein
MAIKASSGNRAKVGRPRQKNTVSNTVFGIRQERPIERRVAGQPTPIRRSMVYRREGKLGGSVLDPPPRQSFPREWGVGCMKPPTPLMSLLFSW